ncbi:unnamed protein product [Rhodiola kirilowii]
MEIVQKEIQKLLDADVIYPISDSQVGEPSPRGPEENWNHGRGRYRRENGDNKGQERLEKCASPTEN